MKLIVLGAHPEVVIEDINAFAPLNVSKKQLAIKFLADTSLTSSCSRMTFPMLDSQRFHRIPFPS